MRVKDKVPFKLKFSLILALVCFIFPNAAHAELSELGRTRIQKSSDICEGAGNDLTYKEYWENSVEPENMQTVCLAEKYADQVASEWDIWLGVNSDGLMKECQEQAPEDRNLYYSCLKQKLLDKAEIVSSPCVELGTENLWDEESCRRLVAYIFIKKFEDSIPEPDPDSLQSSISGLSMVNSWRIKQATAQCEQTNDKIKYKEYWGKSLDSGSRKTTCIAEQFAHLVAGDGYQWLNEKAVNLIKQCRLQAKRDTRIYSYCLQKNLDSVSMALSSPCIEMGEQGLWDEQMCRQLVSYIFAKDFEEVLEENMSIFEKIPHSIKKFSRKTPVRIIFNPITAILALIIFILDAILVITPANWSQVSKLGLIMGPLILAASFLGGAVRFFLSLIVIFTLLLVVFWNHNKSLFERTKKDSSVKIID